MTSNNPKNTVPTTAESAFVAILEAAAAHMAPIGHVVAEIRGLTWGDAYQYGGATSDVWPYCYGTLSEPSFRPDELVLLTPEASRALLARPQAVPGLRSPWVIEREMACRALRRFFGYEVGR